MEPILAVGLACIAYVVIFVGVSWLKDLFIIGGTNKCGVYTVF